MGRRVPGHWGGGGGGGGGVQEGCVCGGGAGRRGGRKVGAGRGGCMGEGRRRELVWSWSAVACVLQTTICSPSSDKVLLCESQHYSYF